MGPLIKTRTAARDAGPTRAFSETGSPSPPLPANANPLLEAWDSRRSKRRPSPRSGQKHFGPAFDRHWPSDQTRNGGRRGAARHRRAFAQHGRGTRARAGRSLARVSAVFHALAGAHQQALMTIERATWRRGWRRTGTASTCDDGLYSRAFKAVWDRRADAPALMPSKARVLERYHTTFRRAGARPRRTGQGGLFAEIAERLGHLGTTFSQNVLADEQAYTLALDGRPSSPACPTSCARRRNPKRRSAASTASTRSRCRARASSRSCNSRRGATCARRRSAPGSPAATTAARPTTRRSSPRRWRCAERARLLGYPTFAHYRLDDAMAKTPEAVRGLLEKVWKPARKAALADRDAMQELIRGGRQLQARRLGLALLRRSCASGAAISTRPSLPIHARPDDRGGVLHRAAGCSGCTRPARTTCRSGIRTCGPGRCAAPTAPSRPVLRRLFRPAVQAQRRLDDRRCATSRSSTATCARSSST